MRVYVFILPRVDNIGITCVHSITGDKRRRKSTDVYITIINIICTFFFTTNFVRFFCHALAIPKHLLSVRLRFVVNIDDLCGFKIRNVKFPVDLSPSKTISAKNYKRDGVTFKHMTH